MDKEENKVGHEEMNQPNCFTEEEKTNDENIKTEETVKERQEEISQDSIEEVTSHDEIDVDKEPTKEFDIVTGNTMVKEEPKQKDNKKLFIIIGAIVLVLVIAVILIWVLTKDSGKNEKKTEEPGIQQEPNNIPSDEECQKVIKEYGNKLAIYVRDYIAKGDDVVNIKKEGLTTLVEGYEVKCETFDLDNSGNITLDKCSINGSDAVYNFEKTYNARPDNDYEIASVNSVLTFYYDSEWWDIYTEKEEGLKKYTLKCEEESCVLDKSYLSFIIVKEDSGKSIVYDIANDKKVYTALAGYDVSIMGLYNDSYEETPLALTLRDPENNEALYSLSKGEIVLDYGMYTYNWEPDGYYNAVMVFDCIKVYDGKKIGLVSADTFELVLEPTNYDSIDEGSEYIYVEKGNYEGVLRYDKTKKEVITIVKPNKYENVYIDNDYVYVKKKGKYGVLDKTGETQLLNGKFYDAVSVADYDGGGVLVLDGATLRVMDLNGNLIKTLIELPAGSTVYSGYDYGSGFGAYNDEEEGINAWIKFTNPNYDENANEEYYGCLDACYDQYWSDSNALTYEDCEMNCEQYYNIDAEGDCMEYYYNFTTGELKKYPAGCTDCGC